MNWVKTLAKAEHWRTAYPIVSQATSEALIGVPQGKPISTADLVARLWPGQGPRDAEGKAAMARLYQAVKVLADHDLKAHVTLGDPEPSRWGTPIRRKLWHDAIVREVQPAAGVQKFINGPMPEREAHPDDCPTCGNFQCCSADCWSEAEYTERAQRFFQKAK